MRHPITGFLSALWHGDDTGRPKSGTISQLAPFSARQHPSLAASAVGASVMDGLRARVLIAFSHRRMSLERERSDPPPGLLSEV